MERPWFTHWKFWQLQQQTLNESRTGRYLRNEQHGTLVFKNVRILLIPSPLRPMFLSFLRRHSCHITTDMLYLFLLSTDKCHINTQLPFPFQLATRKPQIWGIFPGVRLDAHVRERSKSILILTLPFLVQRAGDTGPGCRGLRQPWQLVQKPSCFGSYT